MNNKTENSLLIDNINSNIAAFQHAIVVAELNYDIWWIYKEKNNRKKYLNILNTYPLYFQTSLHAHFVAMILPLYRLYEKRKDTMNIPQLIRLCKEQSILTNDIIKGIESDINSIRPLWRKVHTLRNNMFGHRANKLSDDAIWTAANVTPNQFKKLIDDSKALVNNISRQWSKSSHAFNLSATEDTIQLLEDLKKLNDKKL